MLSLIENPERKQTPATGGRTFCFFEIAEALGHERGFICGAMERPTEELRVVEAPTRSNDRQCVFS